MHLLQPQTEVNFSSLVSTLPTTNSDTSPPQVQLSDWAKLNTEAEQVDWLILHFNHWFSHLNVNLVKGDFEPEYFPATATQPVCLPHSPSLLQPSDVTPLHPQHTPQDLVCMLSQRRRRRPRARRTMAILDRRVNDADLPTRLVLHLDHHAPSNGVLVMQRVVHVVDGGVRHAPALEDGEPLLRRARGRDGLDGRLELVAVRHPLRVGREPRVRLPLGPPNAVAQDPVQPVVAAPEQHIPILGLERLVRHNGRWGIRVSRGVRGRARGADARAECASPVRGGGKGEVSVF